MAAVGGTDCVDATICLGTMNWAVGQLYTDKHFPAATKVAMEGLTDNLMKAFANRIQALDWMSEGMDFADALHLGKAERCTAFLSFDRKLAKAAVGRSSVEVEAP